MLGVVTNYLILRFTSFFEFQICQYPKSFVLHGAFSKVIKSIELEALDAVVGVNNQAANNKRREKDVMKLMMSGKFDVQLVNENST